MASWPIETVTLEDKIHVYRVFKNKRKLIRIETNREYPDRNAEIKVEPVRGRSFAMTLDRHRDMVGPRFKDEDPMMRDTILPLVSMAGGRLDPFDYNGMIRSVTNAERDGTLTMDAARELRLYLMERFF